MWPFTKRPVQVCDGLTVGQIVQHKVSQQRVVIACFYRGNCGAQLAEVRSGLEDKDDYYCYVSELEVAKGGA